MSLFSKAQTYVTIPDTNFVTWLQIVYPSCMNGNQMDIACWDIQNATEVNVSNANISDLSGIEYFSGIWLLECTSNNLTNIPDLSGLQSLFGIYFENNQLTSLPSLPPSLSFIQCSNNHLSSLPALPNSITNLNCSQNQLTSLPSLPDSLHDFVCSYNQLSSLPALPSNLRYFHCANNQLTNLPSLPNSLQDLFCQNNLLVSLPPLSNSQRDLRCSNNSLTNIPPIPNSLLRLFCNKNYLTNLPILTNNITTLHCDSNNISCFSLFPNSIYDFSIKGNPFTCLPNHLFSMDSLTLTYPICSNNIINNPSGCYNSVCFANYTTSYDSVQNIFNLTTDPLTTSMAVSYHWDFGDGSTSILAIPSHNYALDSLYNVCMKIFTNSGDSCSYCHILGKDSLGNIIRTSGFTLNVQQTTSLSEVYSTISEKIDFSVFPNPFNSETTVLFEKEMKSSSIRLIDMYGVKHIELNFTGKQFFIEKGNLKEGVYILQVIDKNKNVSNRKIIIE